MTVRALFLNGDLVAAPSWAALEDALMDEMWNPHRPAAFRREMRLRARNWAGAEVKKDGESAEFLTRLESAGLFVLEVEE